MFQILALLSNCIFVVDKNVKRVKTTKFSHMYVSPMLENGLSLTLLCYKMVTQFLHAYMIIYKNLTQNITKGQKGSKRV